MPNAKADVYKEKAFCFVNIVNCDKLVNMIKDKTIPIATRVEKEVGKVAHKKARSQGRTLSVVLRAFIRAWVKEEIPDPPFSSEKKKEGTTKLI